MARTSLAICVILGLLTTAGCNRQKRGGGAPPPQATSFPPCSPVDPGKPVQEADWSGTEMCNQENQKDVHMALAPVNISKKACPGIHIHQDDQDFTLNISPLADTGNCPANPFNNKFPYDSIAGKNRHFHTDKAKDSAMGCSYEIVYQPKSGTKCDPHIDITP